jgi:hypothetical protein
MPDMELVNMDYMFHTQLRRIRTPVTTAFFTLDNLVYISTRVSQEVRQKLRTHNNIIIVPTIEYFQYLVDVVESVTNRMDVYHTICVVDQQVVDHEVDVHYNSIRQNELFYKWFVFNDRPLVMNGPVLTHGRRRYQPISNGMYAVNGPASNNFQAFQDFNQALRRKSIPQPPLLDHCF